MDNQSFEVNLIENLTSEHSEEIELEADCEFSWSLRISTLIKLLIMLWIGHQA